ncbi:MAG TPA: hypothetical protein VHG08_03585 [Longimicrobium sp.]|nr:hypothetical protein [Longimicrobium sp.]
MKKLALSLAALSLVAAPALSAQTSTATVNASATVEASLTAATTHQLKFGTLAMGASSTLASSGGSQAALSGLASAGLGQIQVSHNSNVSVTAVIPAALTNSVTGTTLGFSATCATASSSGGSGTDTGGCASFSFNAGTPGTAQSTFVLIGGTVTGNAAAGVGTFTGDLEFTFTAVN